MTSFDFTGLSTIFDRPYVGVDIENARIIFEIFFELPKKKKKVRCQKQHITSQKKVLQRLNEARYAHN